MKLAFLPALSLVGRAIAAPAVATASQELAKNDGKLIQKAWQDIGVQYQRMDAAFQAIRKPITIGAFGQTNIPSIHTDIVQLYRNTAYTLSRSAPISLAEGTGLIGPAQTLANIQKATIARVAAMKPQIESAGEGYNIWRMLMEQNEEYKLWATTLNALMAPSQKAMASSFAGQVITAYSAAIEKFLV
jgi:hypothetical protein